MKVPPKRCLHPARPVGVTWPFSPSTEGRRTSSLHMSDGFPSMGAHGARVPVSQALPVEMWCFCAIADEAASPASTTWEHLRQSTTRLGPYTNPDHSRTFPRSDTRPRDQLHHAAEKVLSDLDQLGQDLDLVDACYSAHSYHVFAHVMEGSERGTDRYGSMSSSHHSPRSAL